MASTKTMKWRLFFPILITMVMLMECIHGRREGQLSSYYRGVFRDGSGLALNQMVVSNESGTDFVYVGGISTLYQLDMDLTLRRQESTVPDPCDPSDSSCVDCDDPCLYETKILEVAPSPTSQLIQCGGHEGKCEFRNLRNISRDRGYTQLKVVNTGMSVGLVASRYPPLKDRETSLYYMYVATSVDPENNARRVSEPITQREFVGRVSSKFIFEYSNYINRVTSAVEYIQGVSWMAYDGNTYNFFIVHSGSERSKLGRICSDNDEANLGAYTEITLSCQSYNILRAVHIDSTDVHVLYGVFTNETHSALCLYTMSDIQEKFVDATCGCVNEDAAGCRETGRPITYLEDSYCLKSFTTYTRGAVEEDYQCGDKTQAVIFAYAQAAINLDGNMLSEGLPGQHSSVINFNKENRTVALVTTSSTSDATLSKIHVKPNGTGRLYETVDLEVNSQVLTDVYINQDSEELFILTNSEILKLDVVNCSQYTSSCAECIGPTTNDGDPFCGWCTLEKKCSRSSECSNSGSDSSGWLQYYEDCIAINNLNPPSQERNSDPISVSFSVSQLPNLESNPEYTCQFDGVSTSTIRDGNNFTCMTPAVAQRPTLPVGEDYVTMSLGIYANTTNNIIVEADYPFFMCSAIRSCSECVSSPWGCDWCVYGSRCTLKGASSCIDNGEVVVENNDNSSCPRLDDLSTEILIPVGLSRAIYLTGKNLPTMSGASYQCILSSMTDGSELTRVNTNYFNSTSVECEATQYGLASPSTLEEQIRIHVEYTSAMSSSYQSLDNEDNSVTLFQCSANDMSCRSCVTTTVRKQLGCGWCMESSSCQVNATDEPCNNFLQRGSSEECPPPNISGIFPTAGPLEGNTTLTISGTNLAAEFNETVNITVGEIDCSLNGDFEPGLSVDCITGSWDNKTQEGIVTVVFEFGTAKSDGSFMYRDPAVYEFSPMMGIVSGGTKMNITGEDLDTGRNIRVSVGDADCIMMEERPSSELIQCITSALPDSSERDNASVIVTFDGTRKEVPGKYHFVSDPIIEDYNPKETIMSGGILLTVTGSGFLIVQSAVLELTIDNEVIIEECSVNSSEVIYCLTPDLQNHTSSTSASSRKRRQVIDVETTFVLDGFRSTPSQSLTLHPDPEYDFLENEYIISSPGQTVMLTGENLNVPAENTERFVTVCFGKGKCDVTEVSATELSCLSPTVEPEGGVCIGDDADLPDVLNIVVFHGDTLRQYLGTARYESGGGILAAIVGGAIGGIVFLCIIIFLVFVCIGHRNYKAQIRHTEMEMVNLMQHSRRQVMEGFFIDQEMTDIEEQLRGLGMPFVSNHDYMKSMLFFGLDVKPATTDPEIPSDMEQRAMLEFSKLLSNKNFLITIIHTLDNCKQISTFKKANIASLLTVVLVMERKFRYFTDVLMTLMSETIEDAAERQRIKQLFKRTETLEDKMLNNWIALAMFQSIKGYVGQPLYKLYQAIKIQCEKGPVDAITGKSFFSLNFDNLLTENVDFEELILNVDSEIGQEPVKVLNVDTITQVKEKILDAMYRKKHTKYQRSAREVDLVLRSGQAGELVISDYDTSTQPSMGWCPINTLQHYGIPSGTQVRLTDKQDMPNSMPVPMNDGANNLFTLFPEFHKHYKDDTTRKSVRVTGHHEYNSHDLEQGPKDLKYYHLVQTEDSEEEIEEMTEGFCGKMQRVLCFKGTQGKRKIREIYLQRLVSVKQSINSFVLDALEAMFTIQEDSYVNNMNNIPFALRFLFNFFDEEASRYDDNVTAATWKNNILPLRFWSTILAHPSFIFNMRQSRTADSSVIVLNQMLDNACKGVVPTLKMNASPSRLLFNKELPDYINLLSMYYRNIQQTPTLEEAELQEECTRIDEEFSGLFSRLTTLRQLYECIRPHEDLLVGALQEDEKCNAAHFASSLERVGNTLDQHED